MFFLDITLFKYENFSFCNYQKGSLPNCQKKKNHTSLVPEGLIPKSMSEAFITMKGQRMEVQ